jgi:hypothetical protein
MSGTIRSTCNTCGATYGGNAGHCKGCHHTFSSDSAFDKHLISRVTAGCHDPATLLDKQDRPVFAYHPERHLWKLADHTGGARLAAFRLHDALAASQGAEPGNSEGETGRPVSVATEPANTLWITSRGEQP